MTALQKYNNLTQRIITGVLGSAAIITGVCYSEWTYFTLFFVLCGLAMFEFYKLVGLDGMVPQKSLGIAIGLLIFSLTFFIEQETADPKYFFLVFPLTSFVFMIKLYKKFERKPFTNIAFTFLGIFYIATPLSLLNIAAFVGGRYNFEIVLGSLLILWASDTGAYFAGTRFGRRKLFERISPKKSWEGFFGGAALALIITFVFTQYFHSLENYQWYIIAVLIIVGGTFGDLIESLLKRSIEIKDSGSVLPGHGGFLDRFDGLLISAPFIVAYLEILA